jgi:hypothetical protein
VWTMCWCSWTSYLSVRKGVQTTSSGSGFAEALSEGERGGVQLLLGQEAGDSGEGAVSPVSSLEVSILTAYSL